MTYKVIRAFRDKENKLHRYAIDDTFPVSGEVSQARLDELAGENNKVGKPLIEKIDNGEEEQSEEKSEDNSEKGNDPEGEFPNHTGSGWYLLSNGKKVQGEEKAVEDAKELKCLYGYKR